MRSPLSLLSPLPLFSKCFPDHLKAQSLTKFVFEGSAIGSPPIAAEGPVFMVTKQIVQQHPADKG